jgi:uncharacterized protein YndB with AHSA1/START domain
MARKIPEHRGRTIRASIRTTASRTQIWEAWADPDKLAQWFPDRAEGRIEEGAIQTWYFDRFNHALPYEVHSAVPGEHLVFTGEPPGHPRFFLEIEIAHQGGSTTVTLANSGFLDKAGWDEEYEGIASGWQMVLATLKLYVEHHFGQRRTQFFAMRPATFEYRELLPFYQRSDLLSRWLTREGVIGGAGDRVALVLQDGTRASGEVLAVSGWEVLMSWNEIAGALALKGFSMGPGVRAVCLHGMGWGLPADKAAELERTCESALTRLADLLSARSPQVSAPC